MSAVTSAGRDPRHGAGTSPLLPRRVVPGLVRTAAAPGPLADPDGHRAAADDLVHHVPGELATRELVRRYEAGPVRGRLARLTGRTPLTYATAQAYAQAVGERHVGTLLGRLDRRWTVLHALPLRVPGRPDSDVDHLVVGPAGVWLVETTHRPAQHVRVDGRRGRVGSQPVGQVRTAETLAVVVGQLLSAAVGQEVPVRAVVAVVGARSVRADGLPTGVLVADADRLPGLLGRRPAVMSSVLVDRIARAAADPRTWSVVMPDAGPTDGPDDTGQDLDRDADAVSRRRREQLLLDRLHAQVRAGSRLRRGRRALSVAGVAALVAAERAAEAGPAVGTVLAALS